MPEQKNCLTCRWCGPWEMVGYSGSIGYRATCQWDYPSLPACIDIFNLPKRYEIKKESLCSNEVGMVNAAGFILRIKNCPAWEPKE